MVRRWPHASRKLVGGVSAGLLSLVLGVTAAEATSSPAPSAPHAADRTALAALYNSTDGPNWRDNANWLTDRPLDAWHGVTTDDDGRVTGLDLHGNELRGRIPPELGGLSGLMVLRLSDNRLSGHIPPELGSLSDLRHLFLDGNELDGRIPPELGRLSNLVILHLGANGITGQIPPELGRLSGIRQLFLNDNELSGQIPPELGGLFYLELLHLTNNGLSGQIPPELAGLSNLTDLFSQGNGAFTCPLDDAAFREWLNAIRNRRGSLCGRAGDRAALVALYDATDGPNWKNNTNWLTGVRLDAWYGVTTGEDGRVTGLKLRDNALSGKMPPELGSLARLTNLDLGGNALSGEIPSELGGLSGLIHLFLFDNDLSGRIPRELGSLANLTRLSLSGNELSGPIPPELGGLSNLTHLILYDNDLTGTIPRELGNLSNLTRLFLSGNGLSGPIPSELHDLESLGVLSVDYRTRERQTSLPGIPWDVSGLITLDVVRAAGRLVLMPVLVLCLFALVDFPGTRRSWDWSDGRLSRQRRLRGLPPPYDAVVSAWSGGKLR